MCCTIYVLRVWAITVLYNLCITCVGYKCVVQFMLCDVIIDLYV